MAIKTYSVQWPLSHDGKDYPAGGEIKLEEKAAEPLLASGVIALPQKKAADDQQGGEQ